jgi:hypothetical protein
VGGVNLGWFVHFQDFILQARDGERGHADLLPMRGAGVVFPGKHVNPMGNLMFTHRAVV